MASSCILIITLKRCNLTTSKDEGTELPGLQITHRPRKVPTGWNGSSKDISSSKCRTNHNLTDKSYSLSKRKAPLRNCYIFNISDLDWTTQRSIWIHFSHQVLPPAALVNFFPQTSLPCSLIPLSPRGWFHATLQLKSPELLTGSPQATLPAGNLPQLVHSKPCHPTLSIFTTGSQ